jgi:AcrR family transcriptional regulator
MSPREEDRREQILDAAGEVFARKGFKGASVKELAAAAHVSPGLLYWYFEDKAGLFAALLEQKIADAFGRIDEHISGDMPPAQFLPAFGRFYISQLELPGNNALFKMMLTDAHATPAMMHRVQAQLVGRILGMLDDYFRSQVAAGRMRPCDTEMVARTFMGGIFGYMMLKHILREPHAVALPAETLVDGVAGVVLYGILPEASTGPGDQRGDKVD